jgi:hypothetical protein
MLIAFSFVGLWTTSRAYADNDFAAKNRSWNGLSDFLLLVVESGVKAEAIERIDINTLSQDDALLIIHPTDELPIHGLTRFMKNGGRLAVLDDYGASQGFLGAYEFGRFSPVVGENTRRLRNNDNLLIATATARHPLTEKVSALVANHPQTLHHNELKPVFSFDRSRRSALVLVGAVGEGRLIAVSDSSVLINNMLEFRGNRTFAHNLVRYLTKDNRGRLLIASGSATLIGRDSVFTPRDSLDGIRQALLLLSRHRLSPLAVYTLTGIVLALLLLIAATALPRASPYIAYADLIKRPEILAGFWGSVRFFGQRGRNLLNPLLVFRFELQEALQKKLGLVEMPPLADLVKRLREMDMPESEIDQLQQLLGELGELHSQSERSALPRINRRKFRDLVAKGTHMLHRLDTMVKNHETRS